MGDMLDAAAAFILEPLRSTPWTDWARFWIGQILDDRFVVAWFLPLLPVLLLVPPRWLRPAIIATGLAFVGYVVGAFYLAFWLAMCLAVYGITQKLAVDPQDPAWRPWPVWSAWLLLGGGLLLAFFLDEIELPEPLNTRLWNEYPWLFPLGWRRLAWEPLLNERLDLNLGGGAPPLFLTVFWNLHNIGFAYLSARLLHYVSELRRGAIPPERRTLGRFMAYACYAPSLIQGPIERYELFQQEIDTCHERRGGVSTAVGLWRIGLGVFKSVVATLYFWPFIRTYIMSGRYYNQPEQIESTWLLYFGVYLHIFWLYLEFSGYCDVAAGFSRLLGYRLVENFRMPWIARSLREFWHRWHISLSTLLRDYIYIPLGGNRRHVTLNLCVTFAAVGLWHDLQVQLALWGVLMGLMLAVNQRWHRYAQRLDESGTGAMAALRRAWLRLWPLPQVCAWALTMHAFAHSLLVFFGGNAGWRVTAELLRRAAGAVW